MSEDTFNFAVTPESVQARNDGYTDRVAAASKLVEDTFATIRERAKYLTSPDCAGLRDCMHATGMLLLIYSESNSHLVLSTKGEIWYLSRYGEHSNPSHRIYTLDDAAKDTPAGLAVINEYGMEYQVTLFPQVDAPEKVRAAFQSNAQVIMAKATKEPNFHAFNHSIRLELQSY